MSELWQAVFRAFSREPSGGVAWGKYRVPDDLTPLHFVAAGATGSGKTTLLRMLLRSILPKVAEGTNTRVLLFDPKAEWNTELVDLGLESRRTILNPFDSRSVAWDMAADIMGEADARELATLIIPINEGPNRYFYDAARKLLTTAVIALERVTADEAAKRSRWTFRDLLLACSNVNDLAVLIRKAELDTDGVEFYLSAEREARSVRMTLDVDNSAYNAIAAAWHAAGRAVSLEEWVRSEGVLVLGASKRYRTGLATVNRLILQRLQQITFDHYDPRADRRSWFIFDEFPALGQIPHLEELLTEGRGRGICTVLGFQHIAHVRNTYRGLTEALLGQCYHHAYFRANDKEMATWVSERFAPLYDRDKEKPWKVTPSPSVTEGDVLSLAAASKNYGFECVIKSEKQVTVGPKKIHVRPKNGPPQLEHVMVGDERRAGFVRRNPKDLELEPWNVKEREELGLPKVQVKAQGMMFYQVKITAENVYTNDDLNF